ncbi:MAG: YfhO family protein [Patescibacteria group bacterium]|nr:YfhO family protein [Patescibacteria group bacterium]
MKFSNWLCFFYIFLISAIFFHPYFLNGKVPLPVDALVGAHVPWTEISWNDYPTGVPIRNLEKTDAFSQFYPWRQLVGEFWRNGSVPLWNHYMFSGSPFLATLHSASLYPLNVFYLFLNDIDAWSLLVYSQVLLSGVFTYLFLKKLNLSHLASLFGAITFSYSGYMIAWLEFATGGHAGLWLPFLLWCLHNYLNRQNFLYIFLISIGFFFVYTAGDFQVPLYITVIYFTYAFYLFHEKIKILIKAILGQILGVFLSLPQLLPTLELYLSSIRRDDPYIVEYFYGIMHWHKITNFIWPDFYGNVVTGNYWGKFGFHEYMAFFGVTALVFLIFGFIKRSKTRSEKYFKIGILFSLIMLFPTPLAYLPYILNIPGLGTSSASRILFVVGFFAATLSALRFDEVKGSSNLILKICLVLLLITAGIGIFIYFTPYISVYGINLFPNDQNKMQVSLKNMIPATLVLIFMVFVIYTAKRFNKLNYARYVLLFLLTFEMIWYANKNTPFSPREFVFPETGIISFLKQHSEKEQFRIAGGIPLNLFMPFRIQSVEGYDSIYPEINSKWYSIVNKGDLSALSGRYGLVHNFSSPLLAYSNLKYIIDYPKNRLGGIDVNGYLYNGNNIENYKKVFDEGRISVYEYLFYLPRIWLSNQVFFVSDRKELIQKMLTTKGKHIFLEEQLAVSSNEEPEYKVTNYLLGKNKISFEIETSTDSYVFHSVSYDDSWELYINGLPAKIFKANLIFQSFYVNAGANKIEMFYKPKTFYYSLWISLATFLFLSIFTVYSNYRK